MIKFRYWLVAGLLAVSLQVLAFTFRMESDDGAMEDGAQGIEIDLGMIGALGDSENNVTPELPLTSPQDPVESDKKIEKIHAPEPVIAEPEKTLAVNKALSEKPIQEKQKSVVKIAKKTSLETTQTTVNEVVTKTHVSSLVTKPTALNNVVKETPARQPQVQRKQMTGQANAISNGAQKAETQSYFSQLAAILAKHKRYPVSSRRRGEEGVVKLYFVVNRSGQVIDFRITESSGFKHLDDAVLKMLKKASPLPAFPSDMLVQQLEVNVPIAFQLNKT